MLRRAGGLGGMTTFMGTCDVTAFSGFGVGWGEVKITFLELANVVDALLRKKLGGWGLFTLFKQSIMQAAVPQNEMHFWLGVFDRCFQKSLCGNSDTDAPRKKG